MAAVSANLCGTLVISSAWGEFPTAGVGETSFSLAGGSQQLPVEGPADQDTHNSCGPSTPSHQPRLEAAEGQRVPLTPYLQVILN